MTNWRMNLLLLACFTALAIGAGILGTAAAGASPTHVVVGYGLKSLNKS